MPPKNKKLTKEEKERLKREEEEKRAAEEEALRLEREKEEQERLETERQEREERERLQAIERERFSVETQELKELFNVYEQNLENLRSEEKKQAKWNRYVNCVTTPDPSVESELNTYISLWKDDSKRKKVNDELKQCEEMQQVIDEIQKLSMEGACNKARLAKSAALLQSMLDDRLDVATLHVLQFAEVHTDGDMQNLSVTSTSDRITLSIWANTTKNPKIKTFSFETQDFTSDFPKQLVLTNVAVRLMITQFDHLSPRCLLYRLSSQKNKVETPNFCDENKKEEERNGDQDGQSQGRSGSAGVSGSDVAKSVADEDGEGSVVSAGEDKAKGQSAKSSVAGDPPDAENQSQVELNEGSTGEGSKEEENDGGEQEEEEEEERDNLLDDESVLDLRQFVPMGGILHFDLLQLPPQPKIVNNWIIREVVEPCLVKLPYPTGGLSRPAGSNSSAPPPSKSSAPSSSNQPVLAMKMKLPEEIYFPEEPRLARWEDSQNCWRTDGIQDVVINKGERTISFKSHYISPLAIVVDQYVHMPFQRWELRPLGLNQAKLSITTAGNVDVEIDIENGLCWLSMPDDLEDVKGIRNRRVSPSELKKLMFNAGLNIFPAEDGDKYVSIFAKDEPIEVSLYHLMAFLSPSLAMSWSKWNAKAPSHQIVFQAVESLDGKPIKEDAWKLYLSSSRSAQLPMIEEDKEFSDLPKENTEVHPDVYNVYKASGSSADGLKRVEEASVEFKDCVHCLIKATRLLTFS